MSKWKASVADTSKRVPLFPCELGSAVGWVWEKPRESEERSSKMEEYVKNKMV